VTIRPITPEDKAIEAEFVRQLSLQTKYERFFEGIRVLSPYMLKTLCDVDYVNTMAFVATIQVENKEKEIGVCRYAAGAKPEEREIAITVADDYPYQKIATTLLDALIEHAKSNDIERFFSVELSSNDRIKKLAKHYGMIAKQDPQDATQVVYSLNLTA
jgi:acetyltransferase